MTARTHDAFALASLVTVAYFFPPDSMNLTTSIVAIIGANIGALIPDMDSQGNRLWDLLPAGDNLGKIFRRVFYKHRTISHSILGMVIFYMVLEFVLSKILNPEFIDPKIILYSVMIGIVSHLLADSLTEEGVPLLYPIKFNFGFPPIKKMRIKTGKWFEKFVVYPAIWIYLVWFIKTNQEQMLEILKSAVI
jgi:inner membrane protein